MAEAPRILPFSPTKYPGYFSAADVDDLQYRFEIGRLLRDRRRGRIEQKDLRDSLDKLLNRAGVTSPAERNRVISHPLIANYTEPKQIQAKPPEEEKEEERGLLTQIFDSVINLPGLAAERFSTAMTGVEKMTGSEFAGDLAESTGQYAEEALQDYTRATSSYGKAVESIVGGTGEMVAGATLAGAATVATAGNPWAGILAGQAAMQTFAAFQAAGETVDAWRNHPAWKELSGKLKSVELQDLERKIDEEVATQGFTRRMQGPSIVDALSGIRLPGIPGVGRSVTNILADSATEGASEGIEVVAQGLAVNNGIYDVLEREGKLNLVDVNSFKRDVESWTANAENVARIKEGVVVGALAGGTVSAAITPMENYLNRKRDANEAQIKDRAETYDKELKRNIGEETLAGKILDNRRKVEEVLGAQAKRIQEEKDRKEKDRKEREQLEKVQQVEAESSESLTPTTEAKKTKPKKTKPLTVEEKIAAEFAKIAERRAKAAAEFKPPKATGLGLGRTKPTPEPTEIAPVQEPIAEPVVETKPATVTKSEVTTPPPEETVESLGADDGSYTQINRDLAENPPYELTPPPKETAKERTNRLARERRAAKRQRLKEREAFKKQQAEATLPENLPFEEEMVVPREQPTITAAPEETVESLGADDGSQSQINRDLAENPPYELVSPRSKIPKEQPLKEITVESLGADDGSQSQINRDLAEAAEAQAQEAAALERAAQQEEQNTAAEKAKQEVKILENMRAARRLAKQAQEKLKAEQQTAAETPQTQDSTADDLGVFDDADRPIDEEELLIVDPDTPTLPETLPEITPTNARTRGTKPKAATPVVSEIVQEDVIVDAEKAKAIGVTVPKKYQNKEALLIQRVQRNNRQFAIVEFKDGQRRTYPIEILKITPITKSKPKGRRTKKPAGSKVFAEQKANQAQSAENANLRAKKNKLDQERAKIEAEKRAAAERRTATQTPAAAPIVETEIETQTEIETVPDESKPLEKGDVVESSREGDVGQGKITSISQAKGTANVRFTERNLLKKNIPLDQLTKAAETATDTQASDIVTGTKTDIDFKADPDVNLTKGVTVMRKDGTGEPKEIAGIAMNDGVIQLQFTDGTQDARDNWIGGQTDGTPTILMSENFGAKYSGTSEPVRLNLAQLSYVIDRFISDTLPGIDKSKIIAFENWQAMKEFADKFDASNKISSRTEGIAIMNGDIILLNAEMMMGKNLKRSIGRTLSVILHEAIGHAGIMRLYGNKYGDFTERLYADRSKEIDRWYAANYASSPTPLTDTNYHSTYRKVSEWLAQNFAESGVQSLTLIDRVILLGQSLVGSKRMTDAQIIKEYQKVLTAAKAKVKNIQPRLKPQADTSLEKDEKAPDTIAPAADPATSSKVISDQRLVNAAADADNLNLNFQSENLQSENLQAGFIIKEPNIAPTRFRVPWISQALNLLGDKLVDRFPTGMQPDNMENVEEFRLNQNTQLRPMFVPQKDLVEDLHKAIRESMILSDEIGKRIRGKNEQGIAEEREKLVQQYSRSLPDVETENQYFVPEHEIDRIIGEEKQKQEANIKDEMNLLERVQRMQAIFFPEFFTRFQPQPDENLFDTEQTLSTEQFYNYVKNRIQQNTPVIRELMLKSGKEENKIVTFPSGLLQVAAGEAPMSAYRALTQEEIDRGSNYDKTYENLVYVYENIPKELPLNIDEPILYDDPTAGPELTKVDSSVSNRFSQHAEGHFPFNDVIAHARSTVLENQNAVLVHEIQSEMQRGNKDSQGNLYTDEFQKILDGSELNSAKENQKAKALEVRNALQKTFDLLNRDDQNLATVETRENLNEQQLLQKQAKQNAQRKVFLDLSEVLENYSKAEARLILDALPSGTEIVADILEQSKRDPSTFPDRAKAEAVMGLFAKKFTNGKVTELKTIYEIAEELKQMKGSPIATFAHNFEKELNAAGMGLNNWYQNYAIDPSYTEVIDEAELQNLDFNKPDGYIDYDYQRGSRFQTNGVSIAKRQPLYLFLETLDTTVLDTEMESRYGFGNPESQKKYLANVTVSHTGSDSTPVIEPTEFDDRLEGTNVVGAGPQRVKQLKALEQKANQLIQAYLKNTSSYTTSLGTTDFNFGNRKFEADQYINDAHRFAAGKFDYDLKSIPDVGTAELKNSIKELKQKRREYLRASKGVELALQRYDKAPQIYGDWSKNNFNQGTVANKVGVLNPWISTMRDSWWVDSVLNSLIMRYAERGINTIYFPNANQVVSYTGGTFRGQEMLYDKKLPSKLENLLKREPYRAFRDGFQLDTNVNPSDVDANLLEKIDYQWVTEPTGKPSRLTMTKLVIPEKFQTEFVYPLMNLMEQDRLSKKVNTLTKAPIAEPITQEQQKRLAVYQSKLFDLMSENYQTNERQINGTSGIHFSFFSDIEDFYDRVRPAALASSSVRNTFSLSETDQPITMTDAYALYEMNHRARSHGFDLDELRTMYEAEKIALQAAHKQYLAEAKPLQAQEIEHRLATNYTIRQFMERNANELETNLAEYAPQGSLRKSGTMPNRREFLQLRAPLNQQSYEVRQALKDYDSTKTGKRILQEITEQAGNADAASMSLLQSGIRGAVDEDGFVLFNDYDSQIQEQYFLSENFEESPIFRQSSRPRVRTMLEGIRDFFNPLAPLGEEKADEYRVIKNRYAGVIGAIERDMGAVAKTFENLEEKEILQVFEAFTHADETQRNAVIDLLPPTVRENVINARNLIRETGLALVSRGLLSQEAFSKHDGSYLPRKYLLYLLNENDQQAFASGNGKNLSSMEYLKERSDTDPYVREFLWGEIKDPTFLTARALIQPNRDMAILDMFAEIAADPEMVQQNSMVELNYATLIKEVMQENNLQPDELGMIGLPKDRIRKVSAFFLQEEARRLREQVASNLDGQRQQLVNLLADKLEQLGASRFDENFDRNMWRVVPTSDKRYGAFRGMLLRKEIYNDLLDSIEITSGLGASLDKLTSFWKWGKVVANVPSWFRNWLSNTMMMHLAGMPLYRIDYRVKALQEVIDKGDRYQTYFNLGVVKSTFSANELRKIDRNSLDRILQSQQQADETGAIMQSLINLKRMSNLIGNAIVDKTGDIYQGLEVIDKIAFAMYMEDTKGMTPEMALIEANKPLFDYAEVSPGLRRIRRHPLGIPFATWLYKATPFFADIITSPTKWHRLAPILALQYGAYYALTDGWTDDEHEKFSALLPDWLRDKGRFGLVLPNRDINQNVQITDMEYILPWASHYQMVKGLATGDYGKFLKEMGAFGSPIISMGVGSYANFDPFRQREIVNEDDPWEYRYMDYAEFIYNNLAPSMLATNGAPRKLIDASFAAAGSDMSLGFMSGESAAFDRRGEPKTTLGQAVSGMLGVNTFGLNLANERRKRLQNIDKRMTKAKVERDNALSSLRKSGRMTPERRKDILDLYREKVQKLREERRTLQRGSLSTIEQSFN